MKKISLYQAETCSNKCALTIANPSHAFLDKTTVLHVNN